MNVPSVISQLKRLFELRAHVAELEDCAEAPYAIRTLERVKRRARQLEGELVNAGVVLGLARAA